MKLTFMNFQLKLDTTSIVTTELCTFSLESCRVCSGSSDIFHIFYYLACGAPSDLKEKLELENASFSVSLYSNNPDIFHLMMFYNL